jgi:hypothetical protein
MKGPGEDFEERWNASLRRAEGMPGWNEMTLAEQKTASSRFRKALERYSIENPMGNRMTGGAYVSLESSNKAG